MRQRPALVVFEHRPSRGMMRLLSPGYRHCFCLVGAPGGWLLIDPLKACTYFDIIPSLPIDVLAESYLTPSRVAVAGFGRRAPDRDSPGIRPTTCVEQVKRVLAIAAPEVWTPRQLFRHLTDPSRTFPPFIDARLLIKAG